jgi:hypothetical protein
MTATGAYPPPMRLDHFAGWISQGERGLSSEAIVYRLTGVHLSGRHWSGKDHPADPSDFRRCEMLLRQVSLARLMFPAMRDVSPVWARFVDAWDDLVATAEQECPGIFDGQTSGRSAPLLYEQMQNLRWVGASTSASGDSAVSS